MWHTSSGKRTLEQNEALLFAEAMLILLDNADTMGMEDYSVDIAAFDQLTVGQKVSTLGAITQGLLCHDVEPVRLSAALEAAIAAVFDHVKAMVELELDDPEAGRDWRNRVLDALEDAQTAEIIFENDSLARDFLASQSTAPNETPETEEGGDESVPDPFPANSELKADLKRGLSQARDELLDSVLPEMDEHAWSQTPEQENHESPCSYEDWELIVEELEDHILWDRDFETGDTYLDLHPLLSEVMKEEMRIPSDYFTAIPDDLSEGQIEPVLTKVRQLCCRVINESS
jgi:hypothetical protein